MRSGLAVLALLVCVSLVGCSQNKSNKEATTLPPPPPLESEPLPSMLSMPATEIEPEPAPVAPAPVEPQVQWEPAPEPEPVRPVTNSEAYVVQKGDTLYSIARRFYGSGNNWKTIAELNGISDPRKLRVGQELILP